VSERRVESPLRVSPLPAEEPHRFLICDSDSEMSSALATDVPRMRGRCSDCGRNITWIGAEARAVSRLEHVCGWCALGRINASTNAC
jgi:hypothetical protein